MMKLRLEIKNDQAKREEFPRELLILELHDCIFTFQDSTISSLLKDKEQITAGYLIKIVNLLNTGLLA